MGRKVKIIPEGRLRQSDGEGWDCPRLGKLLSKHGGIDLMEFTDKTLNCGECGAGFTFTAGEQEFYHEKGFQNEPKRCPDCRTSRKRDRRGKSSELHSVVCAECGAETQVPFEPTQGRPVYCRDCFESQKA
jgi:CxxC-x17-CxxC domain-containing protein